MVRKTVWFLLNAASVWLIGDTLTWAQPAQPKATQPKSLPALATGDTYFQRALQRHQAGDDRGMIDDLTAALKIDPTNAPLYLTTRARFAVDRQQRLADVNQALKQAPKYAAAWSVRGSIYLFQGEYDKALADLDQALQYDPKDAESYNYRGLAHYKKGDSARALTDFDQAIKLASKPFAPYYHSRGRAHLDLGNYAKAAADFDEQIKLAPDDEVGYSDRGRVEFAQRRYSAAKAYFDQAIKRHPKFAIAFFLRGKALDALNDRATALPDFQKAAELDPALWEAFTEQAYILSSQGKSLDAEIAIAEMLKQNPQSVAAYIAAGEYHNDGGDSDLAIDYYDRALKLDPTNLQALQLRAQAYYDEQEFEKAMLDCAAILRLYPADKQTLHLRGKLHLNNDEADKALADFNQTIKLGGPPTAYCYRAGIHYSHKDLAKAVEDFTAAIQLGVNAYVARGDCYYEQGEYAKALADYQQPIQQKSSLPKPYQSLAWLRATCPDEKFRDGKQAVELAQQALQRKPGGNVAIYQTLAAAHAEAGNFAAACEALEKAKSFYRQSVPKNLEAALQQYQAKRPTRATEQPDPEPWGWFLLN